MTKDQRHNIWLVPAYLPYRQPKLTAEALSEAENKLGVRLPMAYIELLEVQNGGYIRFSGLNGLNRVIYGVGPFFPNIIDNDWSVYDGYLTIDLDGLIPFDGDGHWYLCLDYHLAKDHPQVTYVNTESDRKEKIADSFEEYLDQLTLDLNESFVVETSRPIADLVKQMGQMLQIEWSDPDTRAYGYPIYGAIWRGSMIWISPNEAPRGFVREGDDRYEELKDEMKGTALRYTDLPAEAILIKVADTEEEKMLDKILTENGIVFKSPQSLFLSR